MRRAALLHARQFILYRPHAARAHCAAVQRGQRRSRTPDARLGTLVMGKKGRPP